MAKKQSKKGTFDELNDKIAKEVRVNFPKGKMLVSGAGFWSFEEEPEFTGYPTGEKVVDPNDDRVLGYHFADLDGQPWVIGASWSIDKAMNMQTEVDNKLVPVYKSGAKLFIHYAGKTTVKKTGQQFNQFDVILLNE